MNKLKPRAMIIHILPVLFLLSMTALFFNKMVFSNLILARGDTFLYFYPYWHAAAEALRLGKLPLWNPHIFMGAPLLANSQMGFFYPLNWPVWLLFETPYAMSASILLHLQIAAIGSYLAARHVMRLGISAALLTAAAFSLGGYLTAQVEHVNQLQGLAWLPWMLLVVGTGPPRKRMEWITSVISLALLFALQLLAGHAQTAFISGVALLLWILSRQIGQRFTGQQEKQKRNGGWKPLLAAISAFFFSGLLALLLSAIQLVPTIELTGLSSRRGGLPINEVLSFSLNPLHLARALLPSYPQSLFSEYIAYMPIIVLALAFIGAWRWRKHEGVLPPLVWIVVAILLALGAYNPLNWQLFQLPGFNLFRVPSRWLILYVLGVAMLAGLGWQIVVNQIHARGTGDDLAQNQPAAKDVVFKPLLYFLSGIMLLAIWGFFASLLVDFIPTGMEAPYEAPSVRTLIGWGTELFLLALILLFLFFTKSKVDSRLFLGLLLAAVVLVLFISSRGLPYNNLTTPEAYFDLRPSVARLMAVNATQPTRFITLSDLFFDPGDQAEIDTIYGDQLAPAAEYDYTIAVKQKEVLSPNLPMLYGLASVDGFDGGVLPLQSYSEQMKLILPEGVTTTDGRLREHLDQVPEARWLDLYNAAHLVTDKVGDIWKDDVFFDRQHPVDLTNGQELTVGYIPEFEATELLILASQKPDIVTINTTDDRTWKITPDHIENDHYSAQFPQASIVKDIRITTCQNAPTSCEITALTLVDERDGAFQTLVPGDYRLVHSGDVKIYENLDVMPRAYFVTDWQWAVDSISSIELMRSPEFDHRKTVILRTHMDNNLQPMQADSDLPKAQAKITQYLPERVAIFTDQEQAGMLVLGDAYYPGWKAAVDGNPAPIYQANHLFRAVYVPAGQHEVIFTFEPHSIDTGFWLTICGLLILLLIMGYLVLKKRNQTA